MVGEIVSPRSSANWDLSHVISGAVKDRFGVLLLTPWFPNRPGDREGNFIHDSTLALARGGLEMSVLVARGWRPGKPSSDKYRALSSHFNARAFPHLSHAEEVKYLRIPRDRLRVITLWRRRSIVGPALRRIAAETRPALIHAHTEGEAPLAVSIGKALGIPTIVTIHGTNTAPHYLANPAQRAEIGTALREAARVVLVGESLRPPMKALAGTPLH